MVDIILEILRALILSILLLWLWKKGKESFSQTTAGWNFILFGFSLLLFGSILDITDNFESLNWLIVVGDTETESFLEKFVGSLGGFLMLAIGLTIWIPKIQNLSIEILNRKRIQSELQKHQEHLEVLVKEKTIDLIHAKEAAEEANKAKSDFLSRMSHELRTPMNAILGFGQMLQMDADRLNETQRDNVKEILDAGSHLLNLIDEVLDLAKIESGKMEISMNEILVDDLLQGCVTLIRSQAEARQLEIIDHVSGKGHTVLADFTRLKQALLNILSNAVKYNREHGRISLNSETVDKHRIRISVTDTGKGLTEDDIAQLFTSFERLNAKSNIEGTGIGLVITKRLVELMGGTIGVESTPGEGCTFWIELELSHDA